MRLADASEIKQLAVAALRRADVPEAHAAQQVDLLLEAELRGVSSHGLLRLERILARIANGVSDAGARGSHTWLGGAFLSVDGERGLGPVVANFALEALKERVLETGVAVAAIRNSNHIGMLSWYAERTAAAGFSCIALSTSEALVHPWGGSRAMIGTNPIAIGVPTGGEPFVMDMATSLVSMGEIYDHANRGEPIPAGWALDADGRETTDPEAAKAGSIAPFGQAKGYALGLAFELLVSSLSGAALGRDVRGTLDDTGICNKGDVFIVMKGPHRDLQAYLQAIRGLDPAEGFSGVFIPGERGRALRAQRLSEGVPLPPPVWKRLVEFSGSAASD